MKKLIKIALCGALSLCCALTFAACGNEDNADGGKTDSGTTQGPEDTKKPSGGGTTEKPEDKKSPYTVTADEWKNAIETISTGKESVKCSFEYVTEEHGDEGFNFKYDSQSGVLYEWFGGFELYAWKDDENNYFLYEAHYYAYEDLLAHNPNFEQVTEISDDRYNEVFLMGIVDSCGFDIAELLDKYAEFSYDEEKHQYTASDLCVYEDFDAAGAGWSAIMANNIILEFENGKLKGLKPDLSYIAEDVNQNMDLAINCAYTYGESVTVPEEILNMPVSKG